tara:strand:+ start:112 stop:606 length:495 start_codon:yes stop_codon:yes gene_type:complete
MSELRINVDDREYTPPSFDDENRKELLWERREETLLKKWANDCLNRSLQHDEKGKKNKILFSIFGIPTMLIPIILGGVGSVVPCHSLSYSLGIMGTGLFSGISMFFNFGKKEQLHFEYQNKFFELFNEIEAELSKPKKHRIACDVYLEKIKQTYGNYCSLSPTL